MKFEQLQQAWRQEMELHETLNNFSLDELVVEADKVNREHRFTANIFTITGLAIVLLAGFLIFSGSVPVSGPKLLELVAIPALYFYIANLYFKALKKDRATDWTLSVRINNEKERMARQVNLYRKLPTHFILPCAVIVGLGVLPDLLDGTSGPVSPTKMGFYIITTIFILVLSVWGLKRAEKKKLSPLLAKLEKLEAQLKEN